MKTLGSSFTIVLFQWLNMCFSKSGENDDDGDVLLHIAD